MVNLNIWLLLMNYQVNLFNRRDNLVLNVTAYLDQINIKAENVVLNSDNTVDIRKDDHILNVKTTYDKCENENPI